MATVYQNFVRRRLMRAALLAVVLAVAWEGASSLHRVEHTLRFVQRCQRLDAWVVPHCENAAGRGAGALCEDARAVAAIDPLRYAVLYHLRPALVADATAVLRRTHSEPPRAGRLGPAHAGAAVAFAAAFYLLAA